MSPDSRIRLDVSRFLWTVGQGHLTCVPEKLTIRVTWLKRTLLGSLETVFPDSHLFWQGSVYRLAPEVPLFRGMLTRPKAFFRLPSSLKKKQPCVTFCHGGMPNKYRSSSVIACSGQDCSFTDSNYHHHLVVPSAWISLTLSRHLSLSFIGSSRSSGLHPESSQSCCMLVRAGHPAFARPCEGVHRSTSPMSSSQLLQQCPVCLVRLIWIAFVMGGRWPYSCCLVGYCFQDLFNIARNILV